MHEDALEQTLQFLGQELQVESFKTYPELQVVHVDEVEQALQFSGHESQLFPFELIAKPCGQTH